ncbi:MAG: hypothetical protein ACD_7C00466G0003, partial [uncultured bacterium]
EALALSEAEGEISHMFVLSEKIKIRGLFFCQNFWRDNGTIV